MTGIVTSARQAVRILCKSPGFTAVAVLTLALGIGGATAIFSVADAVVLRPLPYDRPESLVVIWLNDRERSQPFIEISYPAFREWRDRSRQIALSAMSAVNSESILTGRGDPWPIEGRWVTGEFFSVLGVAPAYGRALRPEDDKPGAPHVVVVSHQLWRDRLSADPGIVGNSITLDGTPHTIIGVMPAGFAYPQGAQFWVAVGATMGRLVENGDVFWMIGVGRLANDATVEAAQNDLTGIWRQAHAPRFKADGYSAVLTPLSETILGPTRVALLGLLAAVGLVLLMTCANVAGLLLVRASRRQFDVSVRQALGASRRRLALDALAETSILALAGGVGGLIIAIAATPLMVALSPAEIPRLDSVAVNARALGFAAAISMLVAVLAAIAPISQAGRASLAAVPRVAQRVISGSSRSGSMLVAAEVAIAVVVLVAAGLVGRSFLNLRGVPLGFDAERLLTVRVSPQGERYEASGRVSRFYQQLLERVRNEPGVDAVGAITIRPLWSTVGYDWPFTVEGQSAVEARRNPILNLMAVSADYFTTMGIPLKDGRVFTERDAEGQTAVVVVGDSMARRVWPGQRAIGKRIRIPLGDSPYHNAWFTVVGVVGDARYRELQATRLDLYMSHLQANMPLNYLVVRTSREPTALASAVRTIVRGLDTGVPVTEVTSMDQIVSKALGGPRFAAGVFGVFGLVALALAALGVYGVLAYTVTCRTQEIGIRMALGANSRAVLKGVLGHTVSLTMAGIAVGLLMAMASMRLMDALLFDVGTSDPATFALAIVVMSLTAIGAALAPAIRAVRIDPLTALRYE
jgi:predicted permease